MKISIIIIIISFSLMAAASPAGPPSQEHAYAKPSQASSALSMYNFMGSSLGKLWKLLVHSKLRSLAASAVLSAAEEKCATQVRKTKVLETGP